MNEMYNFIFENIRENDIVVCATSGGVDSMSLLNILIDYSKKVNFKIICAHINHNLREESIEEYEFVKSFCNSNNIIFEGTTFEKNINGNLESEFRKKRYNFFDEIIKKYDAKYLLTAHHGDDLIETILMRIVRGSSIEGYSGFNKIVDKGHYKILRPLIFLTKDEIYKYAVENNIEYREDKTNQSDEYTRNRYRKYILPKLKEENKNVHNKFYKFSEELIGSYNFIHHYVIEFLDNNYYKNRLNIDNLLYCDDFIIKKILYEIFKDIYKDDLYRLTDNNINEVIKIIKSDKPNLQINLPMNYIVYKNYNYLEIKENEINNDYKYEINELVNLGNGIIKKIDSTSLKNNYVCHLDSSIIKLPLYVRNRRCGDYIEILGMDGKRKIKDIFIDSKIPKNKRNTYPIVVDSDDNIVWIPGIKKSKYDRLKNEKYDIILWYIEEENNE